MDSPPPQGRPFIPNLITEAYVTDPLPGRIMETIGTKRSLKKITIAECIELDGTIH